MQITLFDPSKVYNRAEHFWSICVEAVPPMTETQLCLGIQGRLYFFSAWLHITQSQQSFRGCAVLSSTKKRFALHGIHLKTDDSKCCIVNHLLRDKIALNFAAWAAPLFPAQLFSHIQKITPATAPTPTCAKPWGHKATHWKQFTIECSLNSVWLKNTFPQSVNYAMSYPLLFCTINHFCQISLE